MAENSTPSMPEIKRIQDLPPIVMVEGRPFAEFQLSHFVNNPLDEPMSFTAEVLNSDNIIDGLDCSEEGVITGTPAKGTARTEPYHLVFVAQSSATKPLVFDGILMILTEEEAAELEKSDTEVAESLVDQDAKQFWQQVQDGKPVDPKKLFEDALTHEQFEWLLERFGGLTVWNADDLSLPDTGKLIEIEGASPKFKVYDFGVAIVATPAGLFDGERSFVDAIQTACALAHEVRKRQWQIVEFTGLDKMKTAAWIEAQNLNAADNTGYYMNVRYSPTDAETELFLNQQAAAPIQPAVVGG